MLYFTGDTRKAIAGKTEVQLGSNPTPEENFVPFLMMRNSKIEADFYATYFNYDIAKCLDECLHRDAFV